MSKLLLLSFVTLLASCGEKAPVPYIQRVEDNQVSCYRVTTGVMTGESIWFTRQNIPWTCETKPTK